MWASAVGLIHLQRTVSPTVKVSPSVYGHDLPLITIMSRGTHGLGPSVSLGAAQTPMAKTLSGAIGDAPGGSTTSAPVELAVASLPFLEGLVGRAPPIEKSPRLAGSEPDLACGARADLNRVDDKSGTGMEAAEDESRIAQRAAHEGANQRPAGARIKGPGICGRCPTSAKASTISDGPVSASGNQRPRQTSKRSVRTPCRSVPAGVR